MTTPDPVNILDEAESWSLLAGISLGRLATSVSGQPDIFPVNFVVQQHTVVIRTAQGTKLASTAVNHQVAFEADDHGLEHGWSVVVKGHAQLVQGSAAIAEAERAQVLSWIATPKDRFIRILPTSISGRRFTFGTAPDLWLDQD